jgi:hypothetical protein
LQAASGTEVLRANRDIRVARAGGLQQPPIAGRPLTPRTDDDHHDLLVAAARAMITSLRRPAADGALPRPAIAALRMLETVLEKEKAPRRR